MKTFGKIIGVLIILIFLAYVGVFFAIKWGWTNEAGRIDENSNAYAVISEIPDSSNSSPDNGQVLAATTRDTAVDSPLADKTLCQIYAVSLISPQNAFTIKNFYNPDQNQATVDKMVFALKIRLKDNAEFLDNLNRCTNDILFIQKALGEVNSLDWPATAANSANIFSWANTEEWSVIKAAVLKDRDQITQAANQADIPPRLLLSACIVEQFRLYFTQREYYEKFFKPYKILGNANTMAWGVMSIKEDTAIDIENNLKDANSAYYPGPKYETLLDFSTPDPKQERFVRLTDSHNHHYSYLYGALYLKEIEAQWQKAGFDISSRPEILATLFNLGFGHSEPKADPAVGGSEIDINGINYTFGALAFEFYYSGELGNDFQL